MNITVKCKTTNLNRSDNSGKPTVQETVNFEIAAQPGIQGGSFSLVLNTEDTVGQYAIGTSYVLSPTAIPAALVAAK